MAGSMKEKGILRAQAVVRERAKRHAQRAPESRHRVRAAKQPLSGLARKEFSIKVQGVAEGMRDVAGKLESRATAIAPNKVATAAKQGGHIGNVAKSFAKSTGKHFAKFASSGAGKAIGAVAKKAGPVGLGIGAAHGAYQTGKAIGHGIKAVSAYRDLNVMRKKSKSKYGTLEAAARTRRQMTGK